MLLPGSEAFPRCKAHFQRENRFISTDLFWWGMGCSSVTVCYVCKYLTLFECRLSFTVRCRHSSGGRMQTQCVASLFLGHMASAPAPCITQHSLVFESNKSAGSQSQGRGHQDVTRPPHMSEAMWQKSTTEKRRALPLPAWC